MPKETMMPLIEMLQDCTVPTWAVFADCGNIFDKKPDDTPRIFLRRIVFNAAVSCAAPNGQGVRIIWPYCSFGLLEMPDELRKKGRINIATDDELRMDVCVNCENYVGITSDPALADDIRGGVPTSLLARWYERAGKVRKQLVETINTLAASKILAPSKNLVAADGSPLN